MCQGDYWVADIEKLRQIMLYTGSRFKADIKDEWHATEAQLLEILPKIVADITRGATKNRRLVRVTGQSGSGKTSQLTPAVEAWFGKDKPVLVAARRFVEYHPYVNEIRAAYGEKNLRKNTDEFSSTMLFLVLNQLMREGYDIILDVALLDVMAEGILIEWVKENNYEMLMTMVAVAPSVAEKWLGGREWRHSKGTEEEFLRVMKGSLEFYAKTCPETRVVIWSAWDDDPAYDGKIGEALEVWQETANAERSEDVNVEKLREAKVKYFAKLK